MTFEPAWHMPHTDYAGGQQTTDYPPGTIIMGTASLTRYPAAMISLMGLSRPAGSTVEWCVGISLAQNLNQAIAHSVGEWVWITADDHNYAPDILLRLLAHGVDLVAPVCLLRMPPILTARDAPSVSPWRL